MIEATKKELITGYNKIFRFYTKSGGFQQLGEEKGVEDMTAYVLMLFY